VKQLFVRFILYGFATRWDLKKITILFRGLGKVYVDVLEVDLRLTILRK